MKQITYLFLTGLLVASCLDLSKAGELGHSGAYDLINQYCN